MKKFQGEYVMSASTRFSKSAALSCAAVIALTASAAHAQTVAAASGNGVETVVVTAQKRSEDVQNVPKVVDVVTQRDMAKAGVTNLQSLSFIDPSIQGTSAGPFGPPAIRGISSFGLSIGVQTQTGIVLDDIPQPSFSTLANELTDVERVEVLPGPQSTLSGRNAAGGLINIVTRNPTATLTGNIQLEQTDDSQTRVGGYVSGPISDNLEFALSGFYDRWAGPIRNLGENGKPLNGFLQRGIRGKLQYQPIDKLTVMVTGFYTVGDFDNTALLGGTPYISVAPNVGAAFGAPGNTYATLHPGAAVGPYSRQVNYPGNSTASNENYGASLRIDYDSDFGVLSSITSYSRGNQPRTDLFAGYQVFGNTINVHTNTDVKYTTQEFRLTSPEADKDFKYTLGAIYSDTDNFEPYNRPILFPVNWDRDATTRSVALYGRATYQFLPDTSITAGLRYQNDYQSYVFNFVDKSATNSHGSANYDFVAGELSLQHDFTDDIKGYMTYSNGQTGQAYDLEDNQGAASNALNGLKPLPSEQVQNYEIGLKTQWLDRRLTINASLFRANYQHYQVQSLTTGAANSVPVIRLLGIGKVLSQGADLTTTYAVTDDLRFSFAATYLDAQMLDYPGAQCFTGQTAAQGCVGGVQDRKGVLPATSKWRLNTSVDYTLPLPSMPFDGTFNLLYRYNSGIKFDLLGNPNAVQGGYGILNMAVGVRDHDGIYSVELFANNLADTHYYNGVTQDAFATGFALQAAGYGRDSFRYFGIRLTGHY